MKTYSLKVSLTSSIVPRYCFDVGYAWIPLGLYNWFDNLETGYHKQFFSCQILYINEDI